ncbi:MAG: metal-dependent transcriptional regulator [Clostridia bacterium]|nr:metal-dependent transcriptional regulator [Clostridia bacterium]
MLLQESGEMYLETIYRLTKSKGSVRSLDVAEDMGYSKPSVSRAVKLLKDGEYITVDNNGYLNLTAHGQEIAEKIFERHTVISKFLVKLGVDPYIAAKDACKIEHVISDESFTEIKNYIAKQDA